MVKVFTYYIMATLNCTKSTEFLQKKEALEIGFSSKLNTYCLSLFMKSSDGVGREGGVDEK